MQLSREIKVETAGKALHMDLNPVKHLGFLLQLSQKLQTSLEISQQLNIFFHCVQSQLLIDSIGFIPHINQKAIRVGKIERHSCCYTLAIQECVLGELEFTRKQKFFHEDLVKLESLTSLLAFPIHNAMQYQEAITHATTDTLTGVGNRANLNATLHRELKLTKRHHYCLSLLLIDVDFFKSINDQYGHQAGDQALQIVVEGIRAMTRDTDRIFRFGGDEFIVLLDNTDEARARLVGERIRMNIENLKQHHTSLPALSVTIGTATLLPEDTQETLFARADSALYRAKQRGRNCVESSLSELCVGVY